jgi:1,4-dihydroxy-2-naphthoate octaprenyltransferase
MPQLKNWILATRPKTLPAGIMPVVIATSIAYSDGFFNLSVSLVALICSVLIQILANFINEIYDFKKGADTSERLGPKRMVASGLISPKQMIIVSSIIAIITFILGLYLVWQGGLVILCIGIFSLVFAYLYTGGPYPLAYLGISDIFVFIFFGVIAVTGTYYLLTNNFSIIALLAGCSNGLLAMNLLNVNNIRDINTDIKVNKKTLAVRLGRNNAITLYIILTFIAFSTNLIIYYYVTKIVLLIPLAALPYSIIIILDLKKSYGFDLNRVLANTGKLLLLNGILISIAFLLTKL